MLSKKNRIVVVRRGEVIGQLAWRKRNKAAVSGDTEINKATDRGRAANQQSL